MAGYRPPPIAGLDRFLDGAVEAKASVPALIARSGPAAVSYGELSTLAERLADTLGSLGLHAGDVVALEAANSVEFVAGLLGAARAGLVVAPFDPALASVERTARLERLGARIVLSDAATDATNGDCPTWTLAFTPGRADLEVTMSGEPRAAPRPGAPLLAPDDRVIMFTAGTTGQPKMVPWTYESMTAVISDICSCYELTPADNTVAVMPFFHGHGLIAGLLAPLAGGGCVLLPARGRFSAHSFWDDVGTANATWITAVPTILEILNARAGTDRPADLEAHLRFVRTCSAPLSPATARAFEALVGAPVLDAYGMTETTHHVAGQPVPANGPDKPDSVGPPSGVKVRIVGTDGHDAPAGVPGEIWLNGPMVTRCYLADAAETAASFTEGWFHTGDLGTLDADGSLFVTGRIKTLINRGGEKIAPEHVEEILDQYPGVAESAVLGQPDPTLGERVVALLVPASGQKLDPNEVVAYSKDRLARYEIPQDLRVVDAIPHTAKGAIDRVAALSAYEHLS
jgi:acyl-CoA synthetase (AMP-forming)/AMP-acid ligase II